MIPKPAYEFKMVLVGESAVGKSCILTRFVDDQYHELMSTIGVDFKFRKIKVKDEEVKVQIWDTAGQESFRSLVSVYYHSADAIVIVYDITSYQTLQSVKEYWITEAEEQNKNNALIFLIGNKIDQPKRQVESFSIEGISESHKIAKCFEVSAKTGENVDQAFSQIAKMLIDHHRKRQSKQTKSTVGNLRIPAKEDSNTLPKPKQGGCPCSK